MQCDRMDIVKIINYYHYNVEKKTYPITKCSFIIILTQKDTTLVLAQANEAMFTAHAPARFFFIKMLYFIDF